jgi:cytochrome c553
MRTLLIALTFVHAMAVSCLAETFQERIGLCLTCHGENGQSDNVEVPSLGAEPAPFVLLQLYLFREKQRRVEPMTDAAKDLTDDDLRQFSDCMAKLPAPKPPQDSPDAARMERGRGLAQSYHCGFCHNRISRDVITSPGSLPSARTTSSRPCVNTRAIRGPGTTPRWRR